MAEIFTESFETGTNGARVSTSNVCMDTSMSRTRRLLRATREMVAEAQRALEKHGPENTMDAPSKTDGDRLAILVEEGGEVSDEVLNAALQGAIGAVARQLTYDHQEAAYERIPGYSRVDIVNIDGKAFFEIPGASRKIFVGRLDDEELAKYGWRRVPRKQSLRKELVQVGAMAATWIALIDKEN